MMNTPEMRAFVVWLRYGSLIDNAKVEHTFREIFELTGVKITTAFKICRLWEQRGFQFPKLQRGGKKCRWVTDEIREYLLSPQTLREWASYPISARTVKFE